MIIFLVIQKLTYIYFLHFQILSYQLYYHSKLVFPRILQNPDLIRFDLVLVISKDLEDLQVIKVANSLVHLKAKLLHIIIFIFHQLINLNCCLK